MKLNKGLFTLAVAIVLIISCNGDESILFPYREIDKYGFIDQTGKIVINAQFAQVRDFREGLAAVSTQAVKYPERSKWGFIDKSGKIVIPELYDGAYEFTEGLAGVLLGEKEGYIDNNGHVIIDFIYDGAGDFVNGEAQVNIAGKIYLIDKTGKSIKELPYLYDRNFRAGYTAHDILVDLHSAWPRLYAYIDSNGEPMTEYRWEYAKNFVDGYGFVSDSPYWEPKDGSELPPRRMNYYIDKSFKPAFPQLNYFAFDSFSEGFGPVFFIDEEAAGYINTEGKIIIQPQFTKIYAFHDGMAAVQLKKDGKWGYINVNGDLVIKPQWEEREIAIAPFKNGLAYIKVPGKNCKGYLNKQGIFVFKECE